MWPTDRYGLVNRDTALRLGRTERQLAAAVHGIDLLYPDRSRAHVTNGRAEGGNTRAQRLTHVGLLPDGDVVEVDGIPVTGIARTVADVALSTGRFPQALTAFDMVPKAAVDPEDLERRLGTGRRGSALARRALLLADGLSASAGDAGRRCPRADRDRREDPRGRAA